MRMRTAALLALALVGCDDDHAPTPAATAAPRPAITSFAALGDQPIPFSSVVAYSLGGTSVHVLASTHAIGCDDLPGAYVREAGEVTVELTLAPLATDRWAVTRWRLGSVTRQGDLAAATPSAIDPDKVVRFDLGSGGPWKVAGSQQTFALGGKLEATGCGVIGVARTPPREQPELRLALDGRPIAIRAATYDAERKILRLSTEPHDCKGGLGHSDVALTLTLGDAPAVAQAKIEGYFLTRTATSKAATELSVTPSEAEEETETQRLEVGGKVAVGGHELELGGALTAAVCPAE